MKDDKDLNIDLEMDDLNPDVEIPGEEVTSNTLEEKISPIALSFLDTLIEKLNLEIDEETKIDVSAQLIEVLSEIYNMGKDESIDEVPSDEDIQDLDNEYKEATERTMSKIEKFYVMCLENTSQKMAKKVLNIREKLKNKDKVLVEQLNSFINTFLIENIDKESVIEAEEFKRLKEFYESIRESVFVNNHEIQNTIREKTNEIESEVTDLKTKYNNSIKERIILKEQLQKHEKETLIAEAISDLDPRLSKNVKRRLLTESLEKIKTESMDIIQEERELLNEDIENAQNEVATKSSTRGMERITESSTLKEDENKDPNLSIMDIYAQETQRLMKFNS